jgi:predicted nucleic acid-binding Zn ribbon protein
MTAFSTVYIRGCARCGLGFLAVKRDQRWCGNACRVAAFQKRKKRTQQAMVDELFRRSGQDARP